LLEEELGPAAERSPRDIAIRAAVEALEKCLRRCEVPDCQELCERHARKIMEVCLEAGGSEQECRAKATEVLESCLGRCEPPAPPPGCEGMCEHLAERIIEGCLAQDGSEEGCQVRADKILEDCLARCEPRDCEGLCKPHAESVLNFCLEQGGSQEDCRAKAEEVLRRCLQRCRRRRIWDLDLDNRTRGSDFAILASAWLTGPGQAEWNPACDIRTPFDGLIDMRDLLVLARNWLAESE